VEESQRPGKRIVVHQENAQQDALLIGQDAYARAKRYSKSHGLTLADALIAATAMTNDFTLISRNEKHFRPIAGLKFLRADY